MKNLIVYIVLSALLFSSCGYSVVKLTDNSRPYAVYVDKKYVGMSNTKIKIQRSGLPQKKVIEVKDNYGRLIAHEKVSRDFNLGKFVAGFFYLYPLWFFMWDYDALIEIYVDNQKIKASKSPWDTDSLSVRKSPWD
jgi:hypothetical protein